MVMPIAVARPRHEIRVRNGMLGCAVPGLLLSAVIITL
jgi:hypothetical protein